MLGQHPDQPSTVMADSTGKAAANINGTTLHSAFALPIRGSYGRLEYKKKSKEKLNSLRSRYANLKIIIADDISMFGAQNLNNLSLILQDILQAYSHPFANISMLAVEDLLQLNRVGDSPIYKALKSTYAALAGSLWQQLFELFELTEVMRQRGNPQLAELLSRVRTGNVTEENIAFLKDLENTELDQSLPHPVHIALTSKRKISITTFCHKNFSIRQK